MTHKLKTTDQGNIAQEKKLYLNTYLFQPMQFSEPKEVVNMHIYSETHICTVMHICKYKYFTYTYMVFFHFCVMYVCML